MIICKEVSEAINTLTIPSGSTLYTGGNAATPTTLLNELAKNAGISGITLYSLLLLGEVSALFTPEACSRITHRVLFNGPHSRSAVNEGRAEYQLMHLSDIPRHMRSASPVDTVLLTVAGPDNGGNFSLGTTVEGVLAAIESAKRRGGKVIAERNARMPFVLGTTIPGSAIDYLLDTDVPLPRSPVKTPDEQSRKIGRLIAELYIKDGSTLQFGIGEVPEAVTEAVLERKAKNLGVQTELFADAMRTLVERGLVTNRFTYNRITFSLATIFLSSTEAGYGWLHMNSSVQSRPSDFTNDIQRIAKQPNVVAVNSAIGVDLHGNVWADSLNARNVYSGVGGQADFLRGAHLSEGGTPIIALKAATKKGAPKILERSPEGITATAIAADQVVIVTEFGAFDPRGLSITERAVGIAHLAGPEGREELLRHVYDSGAFKRPTGGAVKGFTPYEAL